MARAVRIDKLSLAALHATLDLYRAPNNPFERVPVLQALSEAPEAIHARATLLGSRLAEYDSVEAVVVATTARAGGGALPQQDLPSFAVALSMEGASPDQMARQLRQAPLPILGRISNDQFLLDMRAVADADIERLSDAIVTALTQ